MGSEAMIDYDTSAQNRTVVEQTPPTEQTAERTELEVVENPPAFSMPTVESNRGAILISSQSCLSRPRVHCSGCFGVSQ